MEVRNEYTNQAIRAADSWATISDTVQAILADTGRRFDKGGDALCDTISASQKSVRGSDPDAALYWTAGIYDDSIVFADKLGSWMYPGDEKANYPAYLRATAAIHSPDDFADKAMAA